MVTKTDAFLRAPDDTSNTGKKKRAKQSTVGADTVLEEFVILGSERNSQAGYHLHSGLQSVQASAQNGTTTGFLWLINPIASTRKVSFDRARFHHSMAGTAIAMTTLPRIALALLTFTGTPSGAALTFGKNDSTNPAPQAQALTAPTGLTITLGQIYASTLPQYTSGTPGWAFVVPSIDEWSDADDLDEIILRPGEGVVLYQPDAGTASDIRKFTADFQIKEWE